MSKRLMELDSVRAAATLSVVMIHVSGMYALSSNMAYLANQVTRFAVPVFIVLSGFSLYYSDKDRPKQSYLEFLGRRTNKVLVPYVLWSFIFILYNLFVTGKQPDFAQVGRMLLYAQAAPHLYFIIIILQLYLLYPPLRFLFSKYPRLTLLGAFLITLYYQLSIYLKAQKINILPARDLFFSNYMAFYTWVFFMVLGMYLAENIGILNKYSRNVPVAGIVWLASFLAVLYDGRLTHTFDLSIKPSVIVYSFLSFVFLYGLFRWINPRWMILERGLKWVSDRSFFIYFCHVLVINLILKAARFAGFGFITGNVFGMLALFLGTCLITGALAWIASYIPYNQYMGGGGRITARNFETKNF